MTEKDSFYQTRGREYFQSARPREIVPARGFTVLLNTIPKLNYLSSSYLRTVSLLNC